MTFVQVLSEPRDIQLERVRVFVVTDPLCPKCQGRFLIMLRERLRAPPALMLEEQLTVVIDIFISLASDPLIASIHGFEGLHAASRCLLARSMDRRKKMPVTAFATQALTRWCAMHRSRMGKRLLPVQSVKNHILKRARTPKFACSKSGHNMFVRKQNRLRKQSGAQGQASYDAHLAATIAKWRRMSAEQREPYHTQAQAEPVAVCFPAPTAEDQHALDSMSPWGLGSRACPCAAPALQSIVADLLPEGKAWLREAYAQCRAATQPEALANCVVHSTEPPLDLNKLRRDRRRDASCVQLHPGLFVQDLSASSILAFLRFCEACHCPLQ